MNPINPRVVEVSICFTNYNPYSPMGMLAKRI